MHFSICLTNLIDSQWKYVFINSFAKKTKWDIFWNKILPFYAIVCASSLTHLFPSFCLSQHQVQLFQASSIYAATTLHIWQYPAIHSKTKWFVSATRTSQDNDVFGVILSWAKDSCPQLFYKIGVTFIQWAPLLVCTGEIDVFTFYLHGNTKNTDSTSSRSLFPTPRNIRFSE